MPWRALTLQVAAGAAEAMSEALLEAGAESVSIDKPDQPSATLCALVDLQLDPATKDVRLPQYSTLQGYEQNIEWSTHRWWAIGAAASEQNGGPSPAGCCNA